MLVNPCSNMQWRVWFFTQSLIAQPMARKKKVHPKLTKTGARPNKNQCQLRMVHIQSPSHPVNQPTPEFKNSCWLDPRHDTKSRPNPPTQSFFARRPGGRRPGRVLFLHKVHAGLILDLFAKFLLVVSKPILFNHRSSSKTGSVFPGFLEVFQKIPGKNWELPLQSYMLV